MSICGWTQGDIFLSETGDGVFTMHVSERRGLSQDGQSFISDTVATLAKMHELAEMGYTIPSHAIALLAGDTGAICAVRDGDTISLSMPIAKAVWLMEALGDAYITIERELALIDSDDVLADEDTEFYMQYKAGVKEMHDALEPLVETSPWEDFDND